MSSSLLYHTQCIRDYQYESSEYGNCEVIWNIRRKSFCCNKCGYPGVSIIVARERLIKGEQTLFSESPYSRIYCSECKNITIENISFLSSSKARITKSLERTIIELRPKMSITDVSSFFDIDWKTVKECEKKV